MYGNKDEAEKCIHIAEKCLASNDLAKAKKFVNKANQLFPSDKAKELLNKIELKIEESTSSAKENKSSENFTRHRSGSKSENSRNRSNSASKDDKFTKDQVESVKNIRNSKDFYEILGVEKNATEDDLKRAYKKLALKFHPDKNKAPGATEAFKLIGKSFAVLSNAESRKRYDMTGSIDDAPAPRTRNGYTYEYYDCSRGFDSDFNAEELFNMFFNTGSFSSFNQHRSTRYRQTPTHERENSSYAWIQFLPLLFLLCMSVFSGLFVRDPLYQLHRSEKYINERTTRSLKVPYYVKESFDRDMGRLSLQQLEREIETDYVNHLRVKCMHEKQQKESLIFKARYYGDEASFNQYSQIKLPNCQKLEEIYG